jgi:hypothetical protein
MMATEKEKREYHQDIVEVVIGDDLSRPKFGPLRKFGRVQEKSRISPLRSIRAPIQPNPR